ncbi:MAG: hypothetical protein LUD51_03220 [Clostridia bacterium]|nr:hypothetical protein [Clostridia bacterium]
MDKISLLQKRRQQVKDAGKAIRKDIQEIIDADSFVEFSSFSFSRNDFYGEDAQGEGVVTGFATIDGAPFCIVAQNPAVLSGGVSKANCAKIVKCLEQAERCSASVIYLLSSQGVRIGEGTDVLEGLASLLLKSAQLKGSVPQYLIVNGEVYGQTAVLAGICDFNFFIDKKSVLAASSPLVISAKNGVNLAKEKVGGSRALGFANLTSFTVADLKEAAGKIAAIDEILSVQIQDCEDLNSSIPELDKAERDISLVFDEGTAIEIGRDYSPEYRCYLGRIGGIAVAALVQSSKGGVEINAKNIRKARDFAELAGFYELPYITFVNSLGIRADLETNNSLVLKETGEYISMLDGLTSPRISVVTDKAIGLGYTLFAAKSMGYDYSIAFADAKIALFDSVQGAEIEFRGEKGATEQQLAARYADENSDPINCAHGGYIDDIVEPALVKQYLIATLQMLLR